jgi:hypothetical protein
MGLEITEEKLETTNLVSTVYGGCLVLTLHPELVDPHAGGEPRMPFEGRGPRPQTAGTEGGAYLTGEIRGIHGFKAFHRE